MARTTEYSSSTSTIEIASEGHSSGKRLFNQNASIVLVGSRGAGKRTLGFIGATHLGRCLVTEDHYFREFTGLTRKDYICSHGNAEFYRRSVETLKEMLHQNRMGCIIECGMASLAKEAQKILQEYSTTNPVIFVTRNSERYQKFLNLDEADARRLEMADAAHRKCSNFEYYNLHDQSCDVPSSIDPGLLNAPSRLKYAKEDFPAFLDLITGQGAMRKRFESPFALSALPPEFRPYTYALSLRISSFPDLDTEQLEAGIDAVQLEIDAISPDFHKVVAKQVAMIRRKLALPIIIQVEDGVLENLAISDVEGEKTYFELLEFGLRLGAEYVVVDLRCSAESIAKLVQVSRNSKIIGHKLVRNEFSTWNDEYWIKEYQRAILLGCDIARFAKAASQAPDNERLRLLRARIQSLKQHVPLIAYNLGSNGVSSMVSNKIFTPVAPPISISIVKDNYPVPSPLPTSADAMRELYNTCVLLPLNFYALGASVSWSLLPAMHLAAYQLCGMTNNFQSIQVSSLDEIHSICRDSNFGGAAITQPFKVQIMSRIAAKSYHAKAIGAVNTIIPLRVLPDSGNSSNSAQALLAQANNRCKAGPVSAYFGDNTDYIGIMNCLRRAISPRNAVQPSKTTGVVIGAGGMARAAVYAMLQLGCRNVFIYNRTKAHAENVANHFNSWAVGLSTKGEVVRVLDSQDIEWPAGYRSPTMIVSCVTARKIGDQSPANFEMPMQWLGSPTGGVVVELAYLPLITPLLKQMRRFCEDSKQPWVIVDGLEVLPEQAIAQFELMTGRKAPKRRMRREVQENYNKYAESFE